MKLKVGCLLVFVLVASLFNCSGITQQVKSEVAGISLENDGVKVKFLYKDLSAREVKIVGDFTMWKPEALEKTTTGWTKEYLLRKGRIYEYVFIVDGKVVLDENNPVTSQNGKYTMIYTGDNFNFQALKDNKQTFLLDWLIDITIKVSYFVNYIQSLKDKLEYFANEMVKKESQIEALQSKLELERSSRLNLEKSMNFTASQCRDITEREKLLQTQLDEKIKALQEVEAKYNELNKAYVKLRTKFLDISSENKQLKQKLTELKNQEEVRTKDKRGRKDLNKEKVGMGKIATSKSGETNNSTKRRKIQTPSYIKLGAIYAIGKESSMVISDIVAKEKIVENDNVIIKASGKDIPGKVIKVEENWIYIELLNEKDKDKIKISDIVYLVK